MDLFHQFQDIYFDIVQLAELITRIPDTCRCGDAEAHLDGQCACVEEEQQPPSQARGEECLRLLRQVEERLRWMEDDLEHVRLNQSMMQHEPEVMQKIEMVWGEVHYLHALLNRIEQSIEGFRLTCDDEQLRRLQGAARELKRCAEQLNAVL
ncbi:MAG: hypothetical protein D6723_12645 [Acidobacteria bacterium]|nr:MAG: hypothetical protein D6723_12645 [Acidobacteriota bacterium]